MIKRLALLLLLLPATAPTPDGTRADCLISTHAVEVEFAGKKWIEAIGQSLNYSIQTGKKVGLC